RLRLRALLAGGERAVPGIELDHAAGVVAEVPQQPPEALRPAEGAVCDDEDAGADPRRAGRLREVVRRRERVASAGAGRSRELPLDVEEHGAGDVAREVLRPSPAGVVERPAAVGEEVPHCASLATRLPTPDAGRRLGAWPRRSR